jgi:hypothetical protein
MKSINNKTGSSLTLVMPTSVGGNIRLPAGVSEITDEQAEYLSGVENVYGRPANECFEVED